MQLVSGKNELGAMLGRPSRPGPFTVKTSSRSLLSNYIRRVHTKDHDVSEKQKHHSAIQVTLSQSKSR